MRGTVVIVEVEEREDGSRGSRQLAREVEAAHLRPAPEAVPLPYDPFAPEITGGLTAGAVMGGVLGYLFALALQGSWAVPGWEMLYSMSPATFRVFWLFMGVALGMLVGGLISLAMVPPPERPERDVPR